MTTCCRKAGDSLISGKSRRMLDLSSGMAAMAAMVMGLFLLLLL